MQIFFSDSGLQKVPILPVTSANDLVVLLDATSSIATMPLCDDVVLKHRLVTPTELPVFVGRPTHSLPRDVLLSQFCDFAVKLQDLLPPAPIPPARKRGRPSKTMFLQTQSLQSSHSMVTRTLKLSTLEFHD